MQGTVIGVMVLGTMEVLTATTGRVVLLVLMGITGTSILVILIQQIAIIVRTASLGGASKTILKTGTLRVQVFTYNV